MVELASAPHSCVLSVLDSIAPVHSDLWLSHGNSHGGMLWENKLISLMKGSDVEDPVSVWCCPSRHWRSRCWIQWDPSLVTCAWARIIFHNLGSYPKSLLLKLKNGVRNLGKPVVITRTNQGTVERVLISRKHH